MSGVGRGCKCSAQTADRVRFCRTKEVELKRFRPHDFPNGGCVKEVNTDQILKEISDRSRRHGVSIAQLCREARIAQSTFVRWKNGKMSPTVDCLNILIRALNVVTAKPV